MKRRHIGYAALSVALVFALILGTPRAGKAFEGIVHTKKVTITSVPMMGEQKRESEETVYYKPGYFKVLDPEAGTVTIVRLDKRLIWEIDQNKKTYTELTFEQLAQLREQATEALKNARKQLQAQLEALPADKRQMMEQMLGQSTMNALAQGKLEFTWKTTSEKQTINGFPCQKFIPLLNGQPIGEVWVTERYNLGDDVAKYFDALGIFGEKSVANPPPFKGLPIKTVTDIQMGPSHTRSESVVVKVEEKHISDKEFELPPGLTKVDLEQMKPQK